MYFSTLVSAAAFAAPALAGYVLEDDYMTDFYGSFNFFTGPDPTHGFVKYVDDSSARSMGLIDASGPPVPVKWGVDTKGTDPEGRASIRLESKKAYNKGLIVIDLEHMPFGCGTWPAFWMFGPNWPYQGEIDILEGVHEQEANALTLHTSTGCSVGGDTSLFTGSVETQNCDVKAQGQPDNAGCSIKSKDNKSYGAGLNDNGGGVYATEWTSDAISIWFFPRDSVPEGVTGDSPDPSTWGTPSAKWVKDSCDIDGIFKDLNIIFDTTFCGDWAGNTWSTSTCASKANTCIDYVRDNPSAFENAFWTVNALKVYQNDPNAQAPQQETPPPEEQPVSTEVPVEQPTAPVDTPISEPAPTGPAPIESAPVESAPVESAPVESAPIASVPTVPTATGIVDNSPPIIESPGLPIATGAPIEQNPDGTLILPGQGNSTGPVVPGDGEETTPEPEVDPSAAPSVEAPVPVSTPAPGQSGGFHWPGHPGGNPSSSVPPHAMPFPEGNNTGYPTLPTGTGAPAPINWGTVSSFPVSIPTELASATGDVAEVWETIYTTQVVTVPGNGPAPTEGQNGEVHATVLATEYQTVFVTVEAGQGQATPMPVAPPIARLARREREQRRRKVQHNARN